MLFWEVGEFTQLVDPQVWGRKPQGRGARLQGRGGLRSWDGVGHRKPPARLPRGGDGEGGPEVWDRPVFCQRAPFLAGFPYS